MISLSNTKRGHHANVLLASTSSNARYHCIHTNLFQSLPDGPPQLTEEGQSIAMNSTVYQYKMAFHYSM
jgi:hypothetical protein